MALLRRGRNGLGDNPAILLSADPGRDHVLDAAKLYDPAVREWRERLVFTNGVLLFGPIAVTPQMAQQARLPGNVTTAYRGEIAVQDHGHRRDPALKRHDASLLVRGLAARLGGTVHPALPEPDLALLATVYTPRRLSAEQVINLLRPYTPQLAAFGGDPPDGDSYTLACDQTRFLIGYTATPVRVRDCYPPALGELRDRQHHDYLIKTSARADNGPPELRIKLGGAALTLARYADGMALDMYDFRIHRPEDIPPADAPDRGVTDG